LTAYEPRISSPAVNLSDDSDSDDESDEQQHSSFMVFGV